jgi:outer membrane protein assembly factor BamB
MKSNYNLWAIALLLGTSSAVVSCVRAEPQPASKATASADAKAAPADETAKKVPAQAVSLKSEGPLFGPGDWNQWGGTPGRNNTPEGKNIPTEWELGEFDDNTGDWKPGTGKNVKWVGKLGSQSYGNPVVANGQVYVGTNNGAGWQKRYPVSIDLGCLLAFSDKDGKFLWQHSSEKLPTGRVHDWPDQGICATPLVEGKRLWYVTSRGEVACLDTEGFYDGEDDGPVSGQLGRLFDVMKNEDPSKDKVAGYLASFKEGKIPADMQKLFEAAGVKVPEGVTVEADGPNYKAVFSDAEGKGERQLRMRMEGPTKLAVYKVISPLDKDEADVIWSFDMMNQLGVSQHNMCSCSVTAMGDLLFVCTSNGVDESHINLPAPNAPSFLLMDKNTGKVLWSDASPGVNILHGQWSSPCLVKTGDITQVVFAGGDGYLYSFLADKTADGKAQLLWKFDANPKESKYILGGRGTRNEIIGTPVAYDGLVYLAVGQDPEHGEGIGHLWCIDPTKRGDVSPELAFKLPDLKNPIPHRRLQAVIAEEGEVAKPNPNSAVVWHYSEFDQDGNKKIDFEETMHRTIGSVAIKNGLLVIPDFSGLVHCLDVKTGKPYWTHDLFSATWGSPLIVEDKVYVGDEEGKVTIFRLAKEKEVINEINMNNSVLSTPVVANNVLYIANKTHVFAIQASESE